MSDQEKVLPVKDEMAYIRINRALLDKVEGRKIGPCFVILRRRDDDEYVDMTILEEKAPTKEEPTTMQEAIEEEVKPDE